MTTSAKSGVEKLAQLLHEVVTHLDGGSPQSSVMDENALRTMVRQVLADCGVDTRPYSYSVESASAATGLSEWKIRELIRHERVAARQEGAKLVIDGESLRHYVDSLPPRGLQ